MTLLFCCIIYGRRVSLLFAFYKLRFYFRFKRVFPLYLCSYPLAQNKRGKTSENRLKSKVINTTVGYKIT